MREVDDEINRRAVISEGRKTENNKQSSDTEEPNFDNELNHYEKEDSEVDADKEIHAEKWIHVALQMKDESRGDKENNDVFDDEVVIDELENVNVSDETEVGKN